ncbi:hypothetical protein I2I05_13430 [Hymenobacter sp. BT683]|uniref:Uncharacterized protein n=1 Tax=Hymenobacter jeongseonensis TaxID=2791027 RepID=A0ABS0IJ79_9BACT|nr:hypothetical protein [Hymenobacter jeongseonensis]MBF9238401.1 hypothetical protein [Hymenobacter jeongseonensis]
MASRRAGLGALLLGWLLLGTQLASAQIAHEKPAKVKAANRQALRDAKRTNSPYKDSHLGVSSARLKRGQSNQPEAQVIRRDEEEYDDSEVDYNSVATPPVKSPPFLGIRLKKKPKPVSPTAAKKN